MPPKKEYRKVGYNIYKDPVTDDGSKKSLKGFQLVTMKDGELVCEGEVSEEVAYGKDNWLQVIYEDGKFYNQTTLMAVRAIIDGITTKEYGRLQA